MAARSLKSGLASDHGKNNMTTTADSKASSSQDHQEVAAAADAAVATSGTATATVAATTGTTSRRSSNTLLSSPPLSPSAAAAQRLALRAELDRLTAVALAEQKTQRQQNTRSSNPKHTGSHQFQQEQEQEQVQSQPQSQSQQPDAGSNWRSRPRLAGPAVTTAATAAAAASHRRAHSVYLDSPSTTPASPQHHDSVFSNTPSTDPSRPQSSPSTADTQHNTSQPRMGTSGSYFSLPRSSREARSPFQSYKKSPASRSSHGIDTAYGPPPAISTQRSSVTLLSAGAAQKASKLTPNALARLNAANHSSRVTAHSSVANNNKNTTPDNQDNIGDITNGGVNLDVKSSSTVESANEVLEFVDDDPDDLKAEEKMNSAIPRRSTGGSRLQDLRDARLRYDRQRPEEPQAVEDMFLNIAQAEARAEDPPVADSRSRLSVTSRYRTNDTTPVTSRALREPRLTDRSSIGGRFSDRDRRLSTPGDRPSPGLPKYSNSPLAASEDRRRRISELKAPLTGLRPDLGRDTSVETPDKPPVRRSSVVDAGQTVASRNTVYRKTQLSHTSNNLFYSSPITSRHDSQDEAELDPMSRSKRSASVVSGGAQSTVWDELEDLKSRIMKLEFTGRLPPASAGGLLTERPRTATTHTSTTMSSSPKRSHGQNSNISPITSAGFDDPVPLHPILHSALAKSKNLLEPDSYHALEAVAADALTLVKLTTQHSEQFASSRDRQLKRKADNMCRSLTELCIALNKRSSYAITNASASASVAASASVSQSGHSSHIADESDQDFQPRSRNRDSTNTITLFNGGRALASQQPVAFEPDRTMRAQSLEPELAASVSDASSTSRSRLLPKLESRRNDAFGSNSADVRLRAPYHRHRLSTEISPSRRSPERSSSLLGDSNSDPYGDITTPTQAANNRSEYIQSYGSAANYGVNALERSANALARVRRGSAAKEKAADTNGANVGDDTSSTLRPSTRPRIETVDQTRPPLGASLRYVSGAGTQTTRSPEHSAERDGTTTIGRATSLREKRTSREYTSDYPLPPNRYTQQELQKRAEQIESSREKRRSGLSGVGTNALALIPGRKERSTDLQV